MGFRLVRRSSAALVAVAIMASAACSKSDEFKKVLPTAAEVSRAGADPIEKTGKPDTRLAGDGSQTLDWCGASYASEGRRNKRYQVGYLRPGGIQTSSVEVVRYDAGGADDSFREITAAAQACKPTANLVDPQAAPAHSRLLTKQVILTAQVVAGTPSPVFTGAVYQYQGDMLVVTYAERIGREDAQRAATNIAVLVARRLRTIKTAT
jgi:hypothetical protein